MIEQVKHNQVRWVSGQLDWRDDFLYDDLLKAPLSMFAWEFLRRSKMYKEAWTSNVPGSAREFGLARFVDPALHGDFKPRPQWLLVKAYDIETTSAERRPLTKGEISIVVDLSAFERQDHLARQIGELAEELARRTPEALATPPRTGGHEPKRRVLIRYLRYLDAVAGPIQGSNAAIAESLQIPRARMSDTARRAAALLDRAGYTRLLEYELSSLRSTRSHLRVRKQVPRVSKLSQPEVSTPDPFW